MAAPQITVFIDYQNVHITGHQTWCGWDEAPEHCLIDPLKLSELLVSMRAPGGTLQAVRVYRGRPDPRKQATLARCNDRQTVKWMDDDNRVSVLRRPLRYPQDWDEDSVERPREKGVDVALAVDLVRMGIQQDFEAAIVVSRDSDLLPALEAVRDLHGPHVEVATWEGNSRLRYIDGGRKLWCHQLTEEHFVQVRDERFYNY